MKRDTLQQMVAAYDVGDLMTERILVVDDEPLNCEVVAGLLEDDYVVLQAESAEAALEIVGTTPLDLIITDQRMPGSRASSCSSASAARTPTSPASC